MDLAFLHDLFDVPADDGPGALMRAAERAHHTLPHLVLSVLERDGGRLTPAASDALARARRRVSAYAALTDRLAAHVPVRTLKGRSLAAHYPDGVLRPQVDVDLLVRDEADLWRAVRRAREILPPKAVELTVFGGEPRHLVVALSADAEDPLLDRDLRVEVSTVALPGDFGAVPPRAEPPADPHLANLLAIAEERFQRPFHLRDALDLHHLARAPFPPAREVVDAVVRYRLAPEAAELLAYAENRLPRPPGGLAAVAPLLAEPAAAERDRRSRHVAPAGDDSVRRRLATAGQPVYGLCVRPADGLADAAAARLVDFGDGVLAVTPIGDYLLVHSERVSGELYEAALAALGEPA